MDSSIRILNDTSEGLGLRGAEASALGAIGVNRAIDPLIHVRINPGRVFAQNPFHPAGLLKEIVPICGREQTQAEKAIGDNGLFWQQRGGEPAWDFTQAFQRGSGPIFWMRFGMLSSTGGRVHAYWLEPDARKHRATEYSLIGV